MVCFDVVTIESFIQALFERGQTTPLLTDSIHVILEEK